MVDGVVCLGSRHDSECALIDPEFVLNLLLHLPVIRLLHFFRTLLLPPAGFALIIVQGILPHQLNRTAQVVTS